MITNTVAFSDRSLSEKCTWGIWLSGNRFP